MYRHATIGNWTLVKVCFVAALLHLGNNALYGVEEKPNIILIMSDAVSYTHLTLPTICSV